MSILDPECNNPTEKPLTLYTSTTSTTDLTSPDTPQVPLALLGGVLTGVLLLIIGGLIMIAVVLVCCRMNRKRLGKMDLAKDNWYVLQLGMVN